MVKVAEKYQMAEIKMIQLESVQLENVSLQIEGLDPVLNSVDLDIPMDKTVLVRATHPMHAVHLLEVLAGRREPQKGKVKWHNSLGNDEDVNGASFYNLISCYFESQRPNPTLTVNQIFANTGAHSEVVNAAVDHFDFENKLNKNFKSLTFEIQKLVLLVAATLRTPQMLVLEDPALGLTEVNFLDYLDWIQYWQRQGYLRHVFLTNNHPTAARHLDCISMFVDEGLVYVEEIPNFKKVVQF